MRIKRYRVDEAFILNPGVLRFQITWQGQSTSGQNADGGDVVAWSDIVTCRADVKSLEGLELEVAQQRFALAKYRIIQHYYAGLSQKNRISWFHDGVTRFLDVLDISDPPGIGRYQIVTTKDYE